MTNRQKLAKRIIDLRTKKGLSSEKLAFISGISKTGLRYIERAVNDPKFSTLNQIAKGLDISLKGLMDF